MDIVNCEALSVRISHESNANTKPFNPEELSLEFSIKRIHFSEFGHFVSSNHQFLSETTTDHTLIRYIIVNALTQ